MPRIYYIQRKWKPPFITEEYKQTNKQTNRQTDQHTD